MFHYASRPECDRFVTELNVDLIRCVTPASEIMHCTMRKRGQKEVIKRIQHIDHQAVVSVRNRGSQRVMWRLSSLRGGPGTPTLRFFLEECRGEKEWNRLAETSIRGVPTSGANAEPCQVSGLQ